MKKAVAVTILLSFLLLCIFSTVGMLWLYSRPPNTNETVIQRLNLETNSSDQEINQYFNCAYMVRGISIENWLHKLSRVDGFFIIGEDVHVDYNQQTNHIKLNPTGYYDVVFQELDELNRVYFIENTTLVAVGERSMGLDQIFKPIEC
jgi:hypothetical protein